MYVSEVVRKMETLVEILTSTLNAVECVFVLLPLSYYGNSLPEDFWPVTIWLKYDVDFSFPRKQWQKSRRKETRIVWGGERRENERREWADGKWKLITGLWSWFWGSLISCIWALLESSICCWISCWACSGYWAPCHLVRDENKCAHTHPHPPC